MSETNFSLQFVEILIVRGSQRGHKFQVSRSFLAQSTLRYCLKFIFMPSLPKALSRKLLPRKCKIEKKWNSQNIKIYIEKGTFLCQD